MRDARLAPESAFLVTNFADVSWLTGFEGDDSYALVTPDSVLLISDSRYQEQISREAAWTRAIIRKKGIVEEVAKQVKRLKHRAPRGRLNLAIQSEAFTLKTLSELRKEFKEHRLKVKLRPVAEVIIKLRHIKDSHEVAITEKAIRIAEEAFLALKAQIRSGQSENEIAGLLGYEMRRRGASTPPSTASWPPGPTARSPIIARAAFRCATILRCWSTGAPATGATAPISRRVLFLGSVPAKIKEIYQIVLEAQLAAIDAIKPGAHGKKSNKAAQ